MEIKNYIKNGEKVGHIDPFHGEVLYGNFSKDYIPTPFIVSFGDLKNLSREKVGVFRNLDSANEAKISKDGSVTIRRIGSSWAELKIPGEDFEEYVLKAMSGTAKNKKN